MESKSPEAADHPCQRRHFLEQSTGEVWPLPREDIPISPGHGIGLEQAEMEALAGAYAMAVSPDGASVYVAGTGGLARFDANSVHLVAHVPYAGGKEPLAGHSTGYADIVASEDFVICADLDGTLFIHDPQTCALLTEKSYEPTVFENSQRVIAGQLRRSKIGITGLLGRFGGASRIAASKKAIYIGGRDGIVTALASGTLSVLSRSRLAEGPQAIGIGLVYLAPSKDRLYASVLSTLHVLTPSLEPVAKLRGSPRMPIFGRICSAAESHDGRLAFAADQTGPSVHVWETATWQWLGRVELSSGGGAATHLVASLDNRLLYASTEWGRFLAFDTSRMPLRCVEEGAGGGPLAVGVAYPEYVYVLTEGRLVLRCAERLQKC